MGSREGFAEADVAARFPGMFATQSGSKLPVRFPWARAQTVAIAKPGRRMREGR